MVIRIEGTHGNSLSVIITLPTKPLTLLLSWDAESERQISKAPNSGASIAHWLLFIDADTHPCSELLAETIDVIESGVYLRDNCRSLFIERKDCDQILEVLMPV